MRLAFAVHFSLKPKHCNLFSFIADCEGSVGGTACGFKNKRPSCKDLTVARTILKISQLSLLTLKHWCYPNSALSLYCLATRTWVFTFAADSFLFFPSTFSAANNQLKPLTVWCSYHSNLSDLSKPSAAVLPYTQWDTDKIQKRIKCCPCGRGRKKKKKKKLKPNWIDNHYQ